MCLSSLSVAFSFPRPPASSSGSLRKDLNFERSPWEVFKSNKRTDSPMKFLTLHQLRNNNVLPSQQRPGILLLTTNIVPRLTADILAQVAIIRPRCPRGVRLGFQRPCISHMLVFLAYFLPVGSIQLATLVHFCSPMGIFGALHTFSCRWSR